MKIFYHQNYNIDFGLFNRLHPFDGKKFAHIYQQIQKLTGIEIIAPDKPITQNEIEHFSDALLPSLLKKKRYVLKALEVPYIPLLPFSFIDKHILQPMRWGVAGTLAASREALNGQTCWNLAGGYHHASRGAAEGFCIYNDIGISLDVLKQQGHINDETKILIIDVDAHHGNGNSYVFEENPNVTLLDIYNDDIYPNNNFTKKRIDINIPLRIGTRGKEYLDKLSAGLAKLSSDYDMAYVVAGTDVIESDPLGGLKLTLDDCLQRDIVVFETLNKLNIPTVFLGSGGYSKDSATAITQSISRLYKN